MTLLNVSYATSAVGTGVYTRNLRAALPELTPLRLPSPLLAARPVPFWVRRAVESQLRWRGPVLHPYWATSMSRNGTICLLDFVQYDEASDIERFLLRRSVAMARNVLALSSHVASKVTERIGRAAIVAPPFPDSPWFAAPTPRPRMDKVLRVAYWGGFHPRKAFTDLLAGLQDFGRPVQVHHTGSPRPPTPGIDLVSHGVLSTTDLVAMVDSCHVAAYPSTTEGFGLPVFEALLRDRPLLCNRLAVYSEFSAENARFDLDQVEAALQLSPGVARASLYRVDEKVCSDLLRSTIQPLLEPA